MSFPNTRRRHTDSWRQTVTRACRRRSAPGGTRAHTMKSENAADRPTLILAVSATRLLRMNRTRRRPTSRNDDQIRPGPTGLAPTITFEPHGQSVGGRGRDRLTVVRPRRDTRGGSFTFRPGLTSRLVAEDRVRTGARSRGDDDRPRAIGPGSEWIGRQRGRAIARTDGPGA
jgi:hypothetical protein